MLSVVVPFACIGNNNPIKIATVTAILHGLKQEVHCIDVNYGKKSY
jgi:hypothetical protein